MALRDTITSTSVVASSIKTLHEPTDIRVLPQHRFKVAKTNLIPAIFFYNGSFVPIHAGHVSVLEDAKRYINNLGTHECLAGYISPSHSRYIAKKLDPNNLIGAGHRLSMIHLAIENLDWIMVDLYEMFQPCNTPLSVIMRAFISRVHSQLPDGLRIDVFWLRGEDALCHTRSSDDLIELGFHTIYVLNRGSCENIVNCNGELEPIQDHHEKRWQEIRSSSSFPEKFHVVQATHMNLSSSAVRACARNISVTREQLQSCVQLDNVTNYIIQHQLWSTRADALLSTMSSHYAFPNEITDLTPKLLSYMLAAYSRSSMNVISYMFEQIGIGKGWNGSLYRLYNIQYSSDSTDCPPPCMVLKLSTGIWQQRTASIEPDFYLKLAPRISNIEIPKCYYAARRSHSSNESLLLLEDLSTNYDSLGPKESLEDSTLFLLIASIASLHAEFFQHPILRQELFTWLPSLNSTLTHYHTAYTLKMADQEHIQLLESRLSPKAFIYAKALVAHIPHLFQTLTNEHYTLSHGDFWINNIFIRHGHSHRLMLFDWQTCCRANGLIDIVFLLRLLDIDRSHLLESQVLELYHQVLVKYGVSHYDASTIREDYYSLALPFMVVICSSWEVIKDTKIHKIIMMFEDIVTYGRKTERTTCECELGI